jgi:EpsI family protein
MRVRVLVVTACLLITAGYLTRAERAEGTPLRAPLRECPLVISDYRGRDLAPFDERTLQILGADEYLNRSYAGPRGVPIGLFLGYYQSQRAGETIHSPQNCLPGAGWEPVSADHVKVEVPDLSSGGGSLPTRTIEINRYVIAKGLDRQIALYWYQSHGRVVASEYWAKFYMTLDAVRMNRTDGALVRVMTPVTTSEADAEAAAIKFVQNLYPLLDRYLPS